MLAIFGIASSAVGIGIAIPYIKQMFSAGDQVQSAYIKRATLSDIEKELAQKKIDFEEIEVGDEGESYTIYRKDGVQIKISSTKDVPTQINTLHKLLRRLTIDNVQVRQIDLRFTRPVVKY